MNTLQVVPFDHPIVTSIAIPASKSYTNRALVLGALTKGAVTLKNPLYSDDTEAMIHCLRTLGLRVETSPEKVVVVDDISSIQNRKYELFARDSGTTMRFLLALLCIAPGTHVLKGNKRLNERPIKGLVDALRSLGANIEYVESPEQPPLRILSSSLVRGGSVTIDASTSSQLLSALLMIAPMLGGVEINIHEHLISKPYVDMTIRQMRLAGVEVIEMERRGYRVPQGQSYQQHLYDIEGDFSSAAYFFAMAALTQSTVTLQNLNPISAQADRQFLAILEKMGNEVVIDSRGITIIGRHILPQSLNMEGCPDQVQTMAVLAAFAPGTTTITGIRSLRFKETDRVHALKIELGKMGIKVEDTQNTLAIYGGNPRSATIDTYGDHRMAMAFAVAGTKLPGMMIRDPDVVNKTFPTFWSTLGAL